VLEERKAVSAAVDEIAGKVTQMPEFQGLEADKQARITGRLEREKSGLDTVALIPVLQNKANHARTGLLADLIAEVDRLAQPPQDPIKPAPGMNDPAARAPQAPTTVLASQLRFAAPKTLLADEADIDQYLQEMKKTLLAQIQAGKKVIV